MIQRIQSIYLLLAAVATGILIFLFPLYGYEGKVYATLDDPIFTTMAVLSTLISLFSIFRYKNRRQQVVSGRINIIINFVLLGFILYLYFTTIQEAPQGHLDLGSFMPLVAVILIAMANRAIMKDEELVRSADRLR